MRQPIPVGTAEAPSRIPLWVKLLYPAFVCALVPYYWVAYTPWNFLYFCDLALLITLAGLWLESAFLIMFCLYLPTHAGLRRIFAPARAPFSPPDVEQQEAASWLKV